MLTMTPATKNGDRIFDVPLPADLLALLGCRPGTTVRVLFAANGDIRVLPPLPPKSTLPTASDIAQACRRWWKSQ